jgi:hypothetical protein
MTQIRATNFGPFGCLFGLALIALMGWLAYHFYLILWYPAPIFFALALIIDYKIPLAWGKRLLSVFQQNPIAGLISMIFAAVFFPFTALGMFLNTLAKRRIERMQKEFFGNQSPFSPPSTEKLPEKEEYTDFEEIESKPKKP